MLANAASGCNARPDALPTRALPREPDAATPRADPSPEVHHMTETPSPEDRAPTEPETVASADPAADPVKASEGNGDPAHPTPEEATAEAAVAADAPALDSAEPERAPGIEAASATPPSPPAEAPTEETPAVAPPEAAPAVDPPPRA